MLVRYILSSVCLRLSQFSQLSFMQAVCIQLTHLSYDDCENVCTLFYLHHQIGSMTHLPLFRVRSWNNGMHCMSFYILECYCCEKINLPKVKNQWVAHFHRYQRPLGSTWIRYRSNTKVSALCLIDVDPIVFGMWVLTSLEYCLLNGCDMISVSCNMNQVTV